MASVTSLDSDIRNLRLSKYTPSAANQVRAWIEEALGEHLPSGDLLDALKDGVVLCKLANLILPSPGIKFKQSNMPFVQMENISHFLRACESPLNMPAHDRFLTVDLYESKDPAQVLQCLSAFSRIASTSKPARFPTAIGGRKADVLSPTSTGPRSGSPIRSAVSMSTMRSPHPPRPLSPVKTGGSTSSHNAGPVSSWSNRADEGTTNPAWNIHQYGYMGGASQGNQGISFGGRRQITSASPSVPSLAEKQRLRREKEEEEAKRQQEAAERERQERLDREAEEERERLDEERRWEAETKKQREEERRRLEQQKREWEEQERQWKRDEEARQKEEEAALAATQPSSGATALNGQFLSHYQAGQLNPTKASTDTPEKRRVQELERQLEEARERERQYQFEREQRLQQDDAPTPKRVDSVERPSSARESEASWAPDDRETLRQSTSARAGFRGLGSSRPTPPVRDTTPEVYEEQPRDSPEPEEYRPQPQASNRTDNYLAQNRAPIFQRPRTHQPSEMSFSSTLEEQNDRDRRIESQEKTKAGAWASKSLLEREMERERERQKEWEADQKATETAARDMSQGSAPGQSWNVNQYGYTGGDSQNRGSGPGSGISMGGRRQIIGPRPQPGKSR